MKFVVHAVKSFILFVLADLVFGLDPTPVYDNALAGLGASALLYSITSSVLATVIYAIPAFLGAVIGGAWLGEDKGAVGGACLGLLIAMPFVFGTHVAILMFTHRLVSFFPVFKWWEAVLLVLTSLLVGVTFNSSSSD